MRNILVGTVLAALALPAFAQGTASTQRIDKRQANQERRIEQGEKSGQLTDKEAARLREGQARVQKAEDRAAADGTVTRRERVRIEHKQDQQSRRIAGQKHDAQHK
jgi:hypothetical protein